MQLKILDPFITPPFYKRIIYFFIISITSDIDFKLFANLSKSSRLLIVILKCISIRLFPFSLKVFVFTFKRLILYSFKIRIISRSNPFRSEAFIVKLNSYVVLEDIADLSQ